jgi:sugar phosphate isomerase/epimerase
VPRRPLAIAAGMLVDVGDPARCVEIAAEAGYDAVGLRVLGEVPDRATIARVHRALTATGLTLLDLELVVLGADGLPGSGDARVLDVARELAPAHLTVVSHATDPARSAVGLALVADALADTDVVPALEFLPASGVRSLADARDVLDRVAPRHAALLVDVLHVVRSGDDPQVVAAVAESLPYVQLCDAAARPADPSPRGLLREAVTGRLLPGHGALPLAAFLRALAPTTPLSVEVLSRELLATTSPLERAVAARRATEAVLAEARVDDVGHRP